MSDRRYFLVEEVCLISKIPTSPLEKMHVFLRHQTREVRTKNYTISLNCLSENCFGLKSRLTKETCVRFQIKLSVSTLYI